MQKDYGIVPCTMYMCTHEQKLNMNKYWRKVYIPVKQSLFFVSKLETLGCRKTIFLCNVLELMNK